MENSIFWAEKNVQQVSKWIKEATTKKNYKKISLFRAWKIEKFAFAKKLKKKSS